VKKPARAVSLEGLDALAALEALTVGDERLAPVYFVYGKERYLVDRALHLLRERAIDPRTRDFNYELYQGKEATAERVVSSARTLPMMAKRRLIMVRDLDAMKADEQAQLLPYLESPSPETVLVLEADKLDQRTRFGQAVKKLCTSVKLEPLYERQLLGFVRGEGKLRGVRFGAGAAELLCEEVGADLGALADTVERLALWAASQGRTDGAVNAEDVETHVASTKQRTVFELADAVGRGDRGRALTTLSAMLEGKESGVRIVAMLARHLRQLWSADALLRERVPRSELPSRLGVPPFFVDGIVEQARRVGKGGEGRFRAMHDALYRADRALKSSRLEESRLLESLVLEMTAQ
jgi:DNA polymerase-3 subunit delta